MIKVVLLDLDDTLIQYPEGGDRFVERYLMGLTEYFSKQLGAKELARHMIQTVKQVTSNVSPLHLNQTRYQQAIESALAPNTPPEALTNATNHFYKEIYPALQELTRPVPAAAPLVAGLLERSYAVALATNPHYPETAIHQRIQWGGLDPANFHRVTHGGNTHFTKPNPHYYEEIMAQMGYESYEAIMVGDSWTNDIVPAAAAGMRTFWIENPFSQAGDLTLADGYGSLEDFMRRVCDDDWLAELPSKPVEQSHIIPRMIANIAALCGMVEGLPIEVWTQHPDPKEWSALEIMSHLVESEVNIQRPSLQKIAAENNPFLPAWATPPQPGERAYRGDEGPALMSQFAVEREITIQFLNELPPEAWNRPARHSVYGPTTLLEMALLTTRHDHVHIQQLCQTLQKCEYETSI
jgi:FMN phosphatase YigB (HAD superfamily)